MVFLEKDHSFPVKEPEVKESKAPTEEDELELHALPPALGTFGDYSVGV